jgi:hypothetical protein
METSVKITGAAVREWFEQLKYGAVIECQGNSYRLAMGTDLTGFRAMVTRPGKTSIGLRGVEDGQPFHMSPPARVGDVVELTADSVTYKVGRGDHVTTWKLV